MYRFSHYLGLAGLIVVALSTDAFSQGNSVGINTATPNPNAVLQLSSPNNNQGLLIPRLTTSQRLAMQLQASEKGLMVFDDTEGLFYYWNGSAWNKLLVSQNLQTLSLDGSVLKVSGANEVDLAGIDTDKQNLTFEGTNLSIDRGNTVDLSSLITTSDADPENELQSLEFSSGVLKLTNDPTLAQVDLSNYDTDVTDDFDGDYNSLTNLPTLFSGDFGDLGNVPADLADGDDVDDADADATNELNTTFAFSGNNLQLTDAGGTLSADLTPYMDNTDAQDLSLAGTTLSISGGTAADLSSLVNDADFDPTNEIQDLDLTANTLTITNNGSATNIDLSPYQQTISKIGNTVSLTSGGSFALGSTAPSSVGQVLKWNGSDWGAGTDNVNDADADATNEFQTLGLAGNILSLTGSGTTIDLTPLGVLPAQSAPLAGYFLGTNGANASWMPLGALAFADDVSSAQIQDGAVGVFDLNTAVAGNGLTGGGGVALAANVAPTGGLEVSSDQLQIKDVVVGTTYNILIGGAITYNNKGQITATGPSDETLKTNIEQIQGVLDKLMQVNGYTYYWKSDENGMIQYGVIAQQLEKYFPELIMNNPSGIKSVSYQGLIPILIEALKEEHARVSNLKEEVEEMKAQLSSNDERFKALEAKLDLLIQSTTTAKAATSSQE
ncbi:MAG: tail fiber domain-containing protein [Imperialibacter sp.]|uniref:tail fiber domain-containing protein n=1 Tax=Imperialibacter sp. TaxID=2038411 RepID=UPI0032ED6476